MAQGRNSGESRGQRGKSRGSAKTHAKVPLAQEAESTDRVLDDLIHRDRVAADERLQTFRSSADRTLAHYRAASPPLDRTKQAERHGADEEKRAERAVTDGLLEQERLRADTVVSMQRRERASDFAELRANGQETQDQLAEEQREAEVTAGVLDDTRRALEHARSEQTRSGEAFGIVTHDLRNPLSIVAINAHLIVEQTNEDATREAAQEIARAAAQMGRLLKDLLDVARLEANAFGLLKTANEIGALLNEVLLSYRPLFGPCGILFTVETPNAAVVAPIDRGRVLQVLSNLLGNALKFTPREGRVSLRAVRRGAEVELTVEDSGPGIEPDALPHVFKRLWQRDQDARRGLGLGLYICETIVNAHGGRIWAESEPGRGATFHFTLPVS